MAARIDTASKWIRASASRIYEAFAAADEMEAWLPPDGMIGTMLAFSFKEGGGYRMRLTYEKPDHSPGKTSEDADEVNVRLVELIPNERIEEAVTFESDDPAFSGEMSMVWLLEPVEEGTHVTVRCENVPAGIGKEDHETGLKSTLNNLSAFVEKAT